MGKIEAEFVENNKLIQLTKIDSDAYNQIKSSCFKVWYKYEGRKQKRHETNFLLYNRYLPAGFWIKLYKMSEYKHQTIIKMHPLFSILTQH